MDTRERFEDLHTALLVALEGWQTGIWTALPCVITQVNMAAMTCEAQATIMVPVYNKKSKAVYTEIPVLRDVPLCFPGGGGFSLTFPVTVGDECLVVFASRAIDAWWAYGGVLPQADTRVHDLSDGFAFVGVKSKPHVIPSISTSAVQLRSNDGSTYLEVAVGSVNVSTGASGTFTAASGQVVTVQNGIVTNII
jgi:hypothetical protein